MTFRLVRTLPEGHWRHFVDGHPQGSIFHTPEMFQVFEQASGHRPTFWAAVRGEEPLALLLPVEVTLVAGPLRHFTTRAVAYGSILHDPSLEGEHALKELLLAYAQETRGAVLFTELRNLSDMSPVQPILEACGFRHEDHLNYLIDLDQNSEEILMRMSRRTRKQIRRSLRQGTVIVEELYQIEQVSVWYGLLQQTYASAKVPLAGRTLFEAAFDILHPRGMIKYLLARVDEVPVAVSAELTYGETVYGWYSGVDRTYASLVPNELLMWHILRWGAENGYRIYDFGGAGKPDEEYGVRDFKAKFGGRLVNFGRNTLVSSPRLLPLSRYGYALWQQLQARSQPWRGHP